MFYIKGKCNTATNSKISAQELKEVGRDELTGVNLGQVDPATLQATKIACGAHMCVLLGAIISESMIQNE